MDPHGSAEINTNTERVSADMGHFRTPMDGFGQVTGIRWQYPPTHPPTQKIPPKVPSQRNTISFFL